MRRGSEHQTPNWASVNQITARVLIVVVVVVAVVDITYYLILFRWVDSYKQHSA